MPGYVPVTEAKRRCWITSAQAVSTIYSAIYPGLRLSTAGPAGGDAELELAAHAGPFGKELSRVKICLFLGAGAYDHYIPSAVKHIISKSEFYTAYTPYQPEISQGMLQAIFEYQSMICNLTKMDVSNASMYDGSTALTEAALMACSATGRDSILVPRTVHPEYREVLKTYAHYCGFTVTETGYRPETGRTDLDEIAGKIGANTAAVILQSPNFSGWWRKWKSWAASSRKRQPFHSMRRSHITGNVEAAGRSRRRYCSR